MIIRHFEKSFDRKAFRCGKESLDAYLEYQASQDIKKKLSVVYVLLDDNDERKTVKGYYTLTSESIPTDEVPEGLRKKIPYPKATVTLLGSLAVDKTCVGNGYGRDLLIDALKRSYETTQQIASLAVVVDPIDELAESFYKKYGFFQLTGSSRMFLPMVTIRKLF